MNLASWLWRKATGDETVYITERFGVRSLHIGSDTIQSAMRLARPNDLELAYTRSMMGFLLFNPAPRRVLMVGLAAAHLPSSSTTGCPMRRPRCSRSIPTWWPLRGAISRSRRGTSV